MVTQLTVITALYNEKLSHYTPFIGNFVQFASTLFSGWLIDHVGRRKIILTGNMSLALINLLIGAIFYSLLKNDSQIAFTIAITLIMVFNVVFGLTLGPAVWLYIP